MLSNSILASYERGEHALIKEQLSEFHELKISLELWGLARADYKRKIQAVINAKNGFFSNELKLNAENFFKNYKRILAKFQNEKFDFSQCENLNEILETYSKAFFILSAKDFLSAEPKGANYKFNFAPILAQQQGQEPPLEF